MKTVEIFRLDMFGLDAYLVQSEENKKYMNLVGILVGIILINVLLQFITFPEPYLQRLFIDR